MNQGIYPLAATMINQLNRVDVLSNNLANLNTNSFKQDQLSEGSFNSYLKRAKHDKREISKLDTVVNTIPKIDNRFLNKTLGAIIPTNNQLDFAIKANNMFFKIRNPKTKEILLTRDGAFNIMDNKLVTKNGYEVLNNDNLPIITEDNFASKIAVVKTDFKNLNKQGNNNYRIKNIKDIKISSNLNNVLQGALEKSNVNSVITMVSLIDSQRRFEQAQKALTGIDSINQKVIDKIGGNR